MPAGTLGKTLANAMRFLHRKDRMNERIQAPEFGEILAASDDDWRTILNTDPAKAAQWVKAAAVYGDIDAQITYAQMLRDGRGVAADSEASFRWFEIAARSKRGDTLNLLARCFETGCGTPHDLTKAIAIYREAVDADDDWARFNLAHILLNDSGTDDARREAFSLLSVATSNDHIKSFNLLGLCFENGWGCEANADEAMRCFSTSARLGDFRGHFSLGRLLLEAGRINDAAHSLKLAVELTPPHLCEELGASLRSHGEARIRALAAAAFSRAQAR